jgi:hypothetical protein
VRFLLCHRETLRESAMIMQQRLGDWKNMQARQQTHENRQYI